MHSNDLARLALAGLVGATFTAADAVAGDMPHMDAGTTATASENPGDRVLHDCAGMNDCKGLGACKTIAEKAADLAAKAGVDNPGAHDCAGQNSCKGLGGCKTTAEKYQMLEAKALAAL